MRILMLGKQGAAFANVRGWRGTGLGFGGGRVAWCQCRTGWRGEAGREGGPGKLRWQVREWPEGMAWEGEGAQGQHEQRTDRTRRWATVPSRLQTASPPADEGVRRRRKFG